MTITILNGGLGNQLFQYALGEKIATQNNTKLKFDISSYQKNSIRNYKLDFFNINANIASEGKIKLFIKKIFIILKNLEYLDLKKSAKKKKVFITI